VHARPPVATTGEVQFSFELGRTLLKYLFEAGRHERGGVLLGRYESWGISVSGVLFPPQLVQASTHCAFDHHSIDIAHEAIAALTDPETTRAVGSIIGWLHSHPAHGLFLSRTDQDTLRSWTNLDERAVAVVADPFVRDPRERIGCWDRSGSRCPVTIRQADDHSMAITLPRAALLAKAVRDHGVGGRWDVLVPDGVVTVFPRSRRPAGNPPASGWGESW
jgi:proteasome lid subunit RPN8/RPN11